MIRDASSIFKSDVIFSTPCVNCSTTLNFCTARLTFLEATFSVAGHELLEEAKAIELLSSTTGEIHTNREADDSVLGKHA